MAGCLENHPIPLLSLSFLPRNNAVIKVNEARGRKTQKSEKLSLFFFLERERKKNVNANRGHKSDGFMDWGKNEGFLLLLLLR